MTLQELMSAIQAQQLTRGIDYRFMSPTQRLEYASECALALSVEVSELASSWPFASWKTTVIDHENIKREIIDCIFFLVNIATSFDITAEDLDAMFWWVLNNNQKRILAGEHKEVQI